MNNIYKSNKTALILVVSFNQQNKPLFLTLQRSDELAYWQSVTGSINHFSESIEDTAKRELQEEIGLDPKSIHIRNIYNYYNSEVFEGNPFDAFASYINVEITNFETFYKINNSLNWQKLVTEFQIEQQATNHEKYWLFNLNKHVELDILPEYTHLYQAGTKTITEYAFLLLANKFTPKISNEHTTYQWLDLDQALETIGFPSNIDLIYKLFKNS